jgi:DNA repair photolyase
MTTVQVIKTGEAIVSVNGREVTVPIVLFAHDQDLREVIGQAIETGLPVIVPSTARLPRPRNSRIHGIQQ